MARNNGEDKENRFQARQTISMKTAVAIGSTVTVGLGVYLLLGVMYQQTGSQTPAAYGLTIFFFLLLILAVAERAGATTGKGGLFTLSRPSQSITTAFGTGWMLIGGILLLTAIFAYEGGLALARVLAELFQYTADVRLISALLVLILLPRLLSRSESPWRRRTFFVYAAILVLGVITVATWRTPLEPSSVYVYMPSNSLFTIAPFLLISLWSLQFVIDHRDQLRKPGHDILPALLLPMILGALIGAILAWVLLLYPNLSYYDNLPLVALAENIHPLLALSILLAMLVFAIIGVNESLSSLLKLSSAMAQGGFLPQQLSLRNRIIPLPRAILILITLTVLLILYLGKSLDLVSVSSVCLLLAITLVNVQDILRSSLRLPENRWLRMPLHPLVPLLAVAISLTGIFLQPLDSLLIALTWIIGGALVFVAYAREGAVRMRQEKDVLSTAVTPLRKTSYRVLAAISDPHTTPDLLRLGIQIAAAHGGRLTLLQVIPSQSHDQVTEQKGQDALHQLTETIEKVVGSPEIPIVPQIRIAPTAAEGILTTLWEEQTDTVILGWPGTVAEKEKDDTTGRVVRNAQSQVVVLHGVWPQSSCRMLVPVLSEAHSPAALSLAKRLQRQDSDECGIVALQLVSGRLSKDTENQARQQLERTLAKLDDSSGIERQVIGAENSKDGIIGQADQYDLLLLGLSDEGFLTPTVFAGVSVAVAGEITPPSLLVAGQEKALRYWLRRSWDQLTSVVPALTKKQQSTVGTAMRLNARASIDFYVLISLATAIAFLGLIQNSAAVIIGAMLVAPLMNPILAMAHGIVKGRLKMLREAANTTFNGVIIAVTIGVLLTLLLLAMGLPLSATTEILARTEPNLLDLLIALASGAVAAYAVSRTEVAGALPGVAIAAALVPPLAVVGYGLGTAQFDIASGSLLLFLTNLAAIVLAAAIVFLLLGFRPPTRIGREDQARFGMKIAVISLLIISIPLVLTTRSSTAQVTRDTTITTIMETYWSPSQAQVKDIVISEERGDELLVQATIFDYAGVVTDDSLAALQVSLSSAIDENVTLVTQTIDARQQNYDSAGAARQLTLTPTPSMTPTPSATADPFLTETPSPLPTATIEGFPSETPQP